MRINRRKFLSLTSVGLASTMLSSAVWSKNTAALLAPLSSAKAIVDSKESFAKAIKKAKAGDTLVITNGRYHNWSAIIDCQGSAKHGVTIRPQSVGGVVFSGVNQFTISGRYVTLDGFHFEQCVFEQNLLDFNRSEHCRIQNCVFKDSSNKGSKKSAISISPGAQYNHITDCRFTNIAARCVNLMMSKAMIKYGVPIGNVIAKNHFQDLPSFSGDNGFEAVKIGTNQPKYGHIDVATIVEENLFLRCNGEREIISNKCGGNTYRNNVFQQCDGELVMRGGTNCLVEGNRFIEGAGGIRISGAGHVIKDNVIINSKGTGIRLFYGMSLVQGLHYQAPTKCLITNNTIINAKRAGIHIGDERLNEHGENGIQTVAPENNSIINNIITGTSGDLCMVDRAPNNLIVGNLYFAQGDAIVSFPGEDPMFADPLFRDASKGDYRLSTASPALQSNPTKGASNAQ